MPDGFNFLNILVTSFLVLSAIVLFGVSIACFKNVIHKIPVNYQWLFYIMLFWVIIASLRSFSLSIYDWFNNFGNLYTTYAFLTPLTMVLGLKIENWKLVFKAISNMFTLMLVIFILYPLFSFNQETILLLRPINLILVLGLLRYNTRIGIKSTFIIFLYIVVAIITHRRLEFLFLLLSSIVFIVDKLIALKLKKTIYRYVIFVFLIMLVLVFTVGYQYLSNLIKAIIAFEDSRTFLFTEFFRDLNTYETLFGKGTLGTYYSEYMAHTKWYVEKILKKKWWGDSAIRVNIEVGYLQLILKGGIILLLLHITFYFKAFKSAIFKAKNKFISRLGYFILIMSFLSLIELTPTFSPIFIVFWMAIGTVLNKDYRLMSDKEIYERLGI